MTPVSQQAKTTTADWQTMFKALQHPHRRQLLVTLLDHNPTEDTLRIRDAMSVDETDFETLYPQMYHQHLPVLETAGYIRWDEDANQVEQGPTFNAIRPLVQLLDDHQDELPAGWL